MDNTWVDFRAVKGSVTMQMVLDHYQINWLRKSRDELRGRCPIHKGEGDRTFHVNLEKNAFNCFSCHARGNVLDFVAAMEQCAIREAAVKIAEWFSVASTKKPAVTADAPELKSPDKSRGAHTAENKPLNFQLKGIDPSHPYLAERGIRKETAEAFGVGYFSGRGSMAGRVVIPIHNDRGELIAYAGRAIDNSEPKYKLPAGFHKSLVLYNLHRAIERQSKTVVVVEGFFDCMHLWQTDFPSVALMGSSMSEQQERLLCAHFSHALLLFDGDHAGRQCTDDCLTRLGRRMWVKAIVLEDSMQPDRLRSDQVRELLR